MYSNPTEADVYEQTTNAIVSAIEQGAGKYEIPWHALSTPLNAMNRKPYRGVNVLMLWAAARKHSYSSNEWATYRQWQEAGAQVRKGERSTAVVFWKFYDRSEEQQEDCDASEDRPRCFCTRLSRLQCKPSGRLCSSDRGPIGGIYADRKRRSLFRESSRCHQLRRRSSVLFASRRLPSNAAV